MCGDGIMRDMLLCAAGAIILCVYVALFALTIQYGKTACFSNTPTNKILELFWLLVAAIIFVALLGYALLFILN